ncbi:hypothetical protein Poli38472_014943 [Pythium oligandrum]|uniref:Transmembrane protein n=1 Tax=Pythium oligandrum TaxID=41045 RepID=A0A8K1C219_PYTOL|nr:hypothetical protein Poli38472_014943 [Pythium oligandrum]|eukprot:TMW54923.1 hypothetical protein Poli38472_014943 [Pythium oligandrum]
MESPLPKGDYDYADLETKKASAPEPSAPPATELEAFVFPTESVESSHHEAHNPAVLTPTISSASEKWLFASKLALFQILNTILASAALITVATIVFLSIALLPLCGLGVFVYRGALPLVCGLAILDTKLANLITPVNDRVCFMNGRPGAKSILCVAPNLHEVSRESIQVVVYFLTLKALIGFASFVMFALVVLPFLPIMREINGYNSNESQWAAGFNVGNLNFFADPVWYMLGCIGIMNFTNLLGCYSRDLTRSVCCRTVSPMAVPVAMM